MFGQPLRNQQGHLAVGAFFRQFKIGEIPRIVEHGDTFTADLGYEPGGLTDLPEQVTSLPLEVSQFLIIQVAEL